MAKVTGTVISKKSRRPLPDASLSLRRPFGVTSFFDMSGRSGSDGSFAFLNVPAGQFTLYASVPVPHLPQTSVAASTSVSVGEADVIANLEVDGRGILMGKVQNAKTGEIIRGAALRILEETKGQFMSASDSSGQYSFWSVDPGPYILICEANGFQSNQQHVFTGDELESGATELNVFMAPLPDHALASTGNVKGYLLNSMGNPVRGADVTIKGKDFDGKLVTSATGFPHGKGNFEFFGVPEGEYKLTITKPGMIGITQVIHVKRGVDNWLTDLRMVGVPVTTPAEIESLVISPVCLESGENVTITVKIKDPIGKDASLSANIIGPAGMNLGFTFGQAEQPGLFRRIFPSWESVGVFKLFHLTVFNTNTGQTYEFPVNAQFEVLPKSPPSLTGNSSIFTVPR